MGVCWSCCWLIKTIHFSLRNRKEETIKKNQIFPRSSMLKKNVLISGYSFILELFQKKKKTKKTGRKGIIGSILICNENLQLNF